MFIVDSEDFQDFSLTYARSASAWRHAADHVDDIFRSWKRTWDSNVGGRDTFEVVNDDAPRKAVGTFLGKPFWLAVSPADLGKETYARVEVLCTRTIDGKNTLAGVFLVNQDGDIYDVEGALKISRTNTPKPHSLLLCNVFKAVLNLKA